MSWLAIASDSPFSLANIPFGIIIYGESSLPRPAVAIGDYALDLKAFSEGNGFEALPEFEQHRHVFGETTLNAFAGLGQAKHRLVRHYLQQVFDERTPYESLLKDNAELQSVALIRRELCQNLLPMHIGDYTDFYAGLNHAFNVGVLFRGKDNALQPNYKHIPVGYHGRASTVVVSGTPIRRPVGQILANTGSQDKTPTLSPCKKLDIELELGAFVCRPTALGSQIPIKGAKDYLFGLVLMNDWSARDIQAWEYVPLGPFLSKSFGTTISPWIVLTDALEPYLVEGLEPGNRESILPYLREEIAANVYDIGLDVVSNAATTSGMLSKTSSKNLLFSFPQMLTHHTVNGCAMNTGDLLGSGTISGLEKGSQGSLLEQTQNGKTAVTIGETTRTFLEDGDEILIQGVCGTSGSLVGFGDCRGRIEPALAV